MALLIDKSMLSSSAVSLSEVNFICGRNLFHSDGVLPTCTFCASYIVTWSVYLKCLLCGVRSVWM
jgi:hypothetical protein